MSYRAGGGIEAVQVLAQGVSPSVAQGHAIRVQHRHQKEHKAAAQGSGSRILTQQEADHPIHHMAWRCLPWVHPRRNEEHLISLKNQKSGEEDYIGLWPQRVPPIYAKQRLRFGRCESLVSLTGIKIQLVVHVTDCLVHKQLLYTFRLGKRSAPPEKSPAAPVSCSLFKDVEGELETSAWFSPLQGSVIVTRSTRLPSRDRAKSCRT